MTIYDDQGQAQQCVGEIEQQLEYLEKAIAACVQAKQTLYDHIVTVLTPVETVPGVECPPRPGQSKVAVRITELTDRVASIRACLDDMTERCEL